MSYEPTNWKAGDTVTSAKLNKMEQGIASSGGVLMVHFNKGVLDKTWKEIQEAMQEKIVCIYVSTPVTTDHGFVQQVFINDSAYIVSAFTVTFDGSTSNAFFVTDSEDGYPAIMTPQDNGVPEQ